MSGQSRHEIHLSVERKARLSLQLATLEIVALRQMLPRGVNLMALPNRFNNTSVNLTGSVKYIRLAVSSLLALLKQDLALSGLL